MEWVVVPLQEGIVFLLRYHQHVFICSSKKWELDKHSSTSFAQCGSAQPMKIKKIPGKVPEIAGEYRDGWVGVVAVF